MTGSWQIGLCGGGGDIGAWGQLHSCGRCRVLVASGQSQQMALIRGSVHPMVYPICRFALEKGESGSLIKGARLLCPVIIGARNLNFKRSVQLHFEKCREAPRSIQAVGKNVAEPDLRGSGFGRVPLQIHIYSFFLSFFFFNGELRL